MQIQTERLRLEYQDSIARGLELAARIDDQRLRRRPDAGGWCAAECLEHLSVTMEVYQKRIREAMYKGKLRPARRKEKVSLIGRIVARVLEPPVGRKLSAPGEFAPQNVPERAALLRRFEQTHRAMIQLIEETDAIDRGRVKVPATGSERMRLPLLDIFAVLAAHDRRHLWQAERAAGA